MKNQTNLIFIHKIFKAIADSIIKIFIPLYILKVTNNIALSMTYLGIYSLFVILFNFLFRKFLQKYGIIAIILHFIPIIGTEALLNFCTINYPIVIISAILMALSQTLYSVPINLIFTFSDTTVNVAKFQIPTNIGKLIFILVSGFLLSSTLKNSFLFLSITSAIFYIICVIPIMYSYRLLLNNYEQINDNNILEKPDKKFMFFHIGFGTFQATIDNCIPLFLYINNLSFQAVTTLMAVMEVLKIAANYLAKFFVKIKKERLSCIIGFIVFVTCLIGFVTIKVPVVLYILTCLCSISFPLTFVPMFKKYCEHLVAINNIFDPMTSRDIDVFALRPALYGSFFIGSSMIPCFVLGSLSAVLMFVYEMFLTKKEK